MAVKHVKPVDKYIAIKVNNIFCILNWKLCLSDWWFRMR